MQINLGHFKSSFMAKNELKPHYITEVGTDGVNVPAGESLGGNMGQYVPEIALSVQTATLNDLLRLNPSEIRVGIGTNMFGVDENGIWLGSTKWSTGVFRVSMAGAMSASSLSITGGTLGGWSINATSIYTGTEDHSGYTANTGDITIYSDGTDASIHANKFYIDNTGAIFATSVTVSGAITAGVGSSLASDYLSGIIAQANLNVSNRGWSQTCAFTVTDADTIAWGAGTLTSADGTAYSITGANTGNMTLKTYIYLDTAVSTTLYQTTTTATTAVGTGKVLVAIAQNGTTEATFTVMQGQGGQNIDAANIVAGSITANEIAASTITAGKMSVSTLSSIVADLGAITAGTITLDTAGYIRGGQTAYNTGTGFFLGYSTAAYKFSIGNSADTSKLLTWDGTDLVVNGSTISNQSVFGNGSDGALTTSGNVTLTNDTYYTNLTISTGDEVFPNGYRLFVSGTLTFAGTGKISAYGGNGGVGANGGGNGSTATGGTAGSTANAVGTLPASKAAGAGADGDLNGSGEVAAGNGVSTTKAVNTGNAASSGTGGAGQSAAKAAGSSGSDTGTIINPLKVYSDVQYYRDWADDDAKLAIAPSPGGGGGGGAGGAPAYSTGGAGGGAGAPGGIAFVSAKTIVTVNGNTYLDVHGGNGGNGGNGGYGITHSSATQAPAGGGGGGAGGDGGVIILVYSTKSGTGTTNITAGTGGALGIRQVQSGAGPTANDGTAGGDGSVGRLITLVI